MSLISRPRQQTIGAFAGGKEAILFNFGLLNRKSGNFEAHRISSRVQNRIKNCKMSKPVEINLDKLTTRVDFYDSCIEQLKRELPKYLHKQFEIDKIHRHMAKSLRGVASAEPNQKLRDLLFLYSQKHEQFDKAREDFNRCEKITQELLDESKKMIVVPVKEIIADQKSTLKLLSSLSAGNNASKNSIHDVQFMQSTLHIHVKMFEKHRVRAMKKLLHTLLSAELRYHCCVVEEISALMQDLSVVDEDD